MHLASYFRRTGLLTYVRRRRVWIIQAVITLPAPMLASEELRQPFTDPRWVYEIKHDGYRCMAGVEANGSVHLATRQGVDCTRWFPELVEALSQLSDGPHIIDGEVCVLREDGTSDFNLLQERARRRKWYAGANHVTLCAFDVLMVSGSSAMDRPLSERKAMLKDLLAPLETGALLFVGELPADTALFQAMVNVGLVVEGVVAKRRDSVYMPGARSEDWRKIKRPGWQDGREWRG